MIPISSTASRPVALPNVRETEREARPAPASGGSGRPSRDEYIPEEKWEPWGRYWPGKDGDGSPKICFDDPAAAEAPEEGNPEAVDGLREEAAEKAAEAPEKAAPSGKPAERCTCDTSEADREIKKLKEKQKELEKQLSAETDEAKVRDLERRLAQVESELRQKDNDTYRRQHSKFTEG